MAIRPFIKSYPTDRATANFEAMVENCWNSIIKNPLLQNISIVQNISISTSDSVINHGLNKQYTGWLVIRNNANIVVYESATVNATPTASIILKASGSGTISLLFF
jgi:hypothetical protein